MDRGAPPTPGRFDVAFRSEMALVCGCYERCVIGFEVPKDEEKAEEILSVRRRFSYAASMVRALERGTEAAEDWMGCERELTNGWTAHRDL